MFSRTVHNGTQIMDEFHHRIGLLDLVEKIQQQIHGSAEIGQDNTDLKVPVVDGKSQAVRSRQAHNHIFILSHEVQKRLVNRDTAVGTDTFVDPLAEEPGDPTSQDLEAKYI